MNPNIATEEQIQRTTVEGLRLLGFHVLCTTNRAKKCQKCGTYNTTGYGADKGIPDLLVTHKTWPVGCWLGIEMKKPGGVLKPEQKELLALGRIVVCRSWEDALKAVKEYRV